MHARRRHRLRRLVYTACDRHACDAWLYCSEGSVQLAAVAKLHRAKHQTHWLAAVYIASPCAVLLTYLSDSLAGSRLRCVAVCGPEHAQPTLPVIDCHIAAEEVAVTFEGVSAV